MISLWPNDHFVTKWSICDQMIIGPHADLLGLFIGDPYEITGFGILKIQPQTIWHQVALIPGLSLVTKWTNCDEMNVGL